MDFYTDVLDLHYLLDLLDDGPFSKKFKNLNKAIIGLVEDYSLVAFIPVDVNSDQSLLTLKSATDKVGKVFEMKRYFKGLFQANGYIYGSGEERSIQALMSCAVGARTESEKYDVDYM